MELVVAVVEVRCTACDGMKVVKYGKSRTGEQRYLCRGADCRKTFQLMHRYKACEQGVKACIVDMALNGSGIRDTARVLSVAVGTVITTLKKSMQFAQSELEQAVIHQS
jgi:transposase-like protein